MMQGNKTDEIDTLAILELMRNGECYDLPLNEGIFNTIKEYVKILDRTSKDMVAQKNRIHAYLDEIYPGLESKLSKFVDTQKEYRGQARTRKIHLFFPTHILDIK